MDAGSIPAASTKSIFYTIKMAQTKKKLSKSAKAALKILEDSKLLNNAKASNALKIAANDKPNVNLPKPSAANKIRPEKKRG